MEGLARQHGTSSEKPLLQDTAQVLVANLSLVRRIVREVCRHSRVLPCDESELLGDVLLKLVDKDYAVIRAYRGECPLGVYLRTVIRRVLLDRRVSEWGKWRVSRKARQLGSAAMEMERLILRDRLTREDAIRLVAQDSRWSISIDAAHTIAAELPLRTRPFTVPLESGELPSTDGCPLRVLIDNSDALKAALIQRALRTGLATLTEEERRLLQLRFGNGHKISEVARELGLDQAALYRRYSQILYRLRCGLEGMRVTADEVRPLLGRRLMNRLSQCIASNAQSHRDSPLGAPALTRANCQPASVS